jgi:hypothetical protein
VETAGDKTQTEFHYQLPCQKAQQQTAIEQLKDVCKDKELTDTCTHENQPDDDDSSSSSESEETSTTILRTKVTQKEGTGATGSTTKETKRETEETTKGTSVKHSVASSSMSFEW